MAEHQASVTIDAPVEQVYALFSHFNDFPKSVLLSHSRDLSLHPHVTHLVGRLL